MNNLEWSMASNMFLQGLIRNQVGPSPSIRPLQFHFLASLFHQVFEWCHQPFLRTWIELFTIVLILKCRILGSKYIPLKIKLEDTLWLRVNDVDDMPKAIKVGKRYNKFFLNKWNLNEVLRKNIFIRNFHVQSWYSNNYELKRIMLIY